MTRMYIQPSFLDSCSDHGEWSGGNDQYRGDRSVDFSTFDSKGRARVEAFSDEALEANKAKRKTSVSLKDRILPQARRVSTLTSQLVELEQAYKSGEYDINEYSVLRDILIVKRNRSMELYKKAVSVKPTQPDEDDIDLYAGLPEDEVVYEVNSRVSPQGESDIGCQWIDDLSSENSLKKPLKIACTLIKIAVHWSHKAATYYKSLKEV